LVDDQPVGFGHRVAADAKVEVFPVENRDTHNTIKR
jgi:hypothetical protein